MVRVIAYIKPHRLEAVKTAVASLGVSGMSVNDVRGIGNSEESSDYLLNQGVVSLPIRSKLEVVAQDELIEELTRTIAEAAWTGQSGDGKIFTERVADAVRIRTMERGNDAI